ncbi:MAG: glycosyltransferase family 2 protein [Fusobacterium sp.]|nr:glycosyltransferase family 2 protein [Fusobacterium sp.]
MRKSLDIIVPVYNEEECLNETIKRLMAVRETLYTELDVNFIFVNDGSKDKSFEILKEYADKYPFVKAINFSRNFGHQFAVSAGLDYSTGDFVAIIDADLQDPPELIKDMYEKALEGYQVVYGKRLKRRKETAFKKFTAFAFYRVFDMLCQIKVPTDTGDFRLITREVVEAIKKMPEKHRFLRAMVPWVGFNSTPLYYNRDERFAGTTHYPLSKMLKLAADGILSFSTKPLKFIHLLAALLMLTALASGIAGIFWDNGFLLCLITALILFVGALQLFALGIIGEYIGRIYEEVKDRPIYIVKDKLNL